MVYVLMKSNFNYGDDYYYPDGQEPRKVYSERAVAQQRCDELNVESWSYLSLAEHWMGEVYPEDPLVMVARQTYTTRVQEKHAATLPLFSAEEVQALLTIFPAIWEPHLLEAKPDCVESDYEDEDPFENDDALLSDDPFGDYDPLSDDAPLRGNEETETISSKERDAVDDSDSLPAKASEFYYNDMGEYIEGPYPPESTRPSTFILADLHRQLTEILGTRMGEPWTELEQWHEWRIPPVSIDEVARLSQIFGLTFYEVVEVEME